MNNMSKKKRIKEALKLLLHYGNIDGSHHKMWVIDQAVRILADDYEETIRKAKEGEDGPDTYDWDEGIPLDKRKATCYT